VTDETGPAFLSLEEELRRLKLKLCTNAGSIAAVLATRAGIEAAVEALVRGRAVLEKCDECENDYWKDEDDRYINAEEFEECFGKFGNKHVTVNFRIEYHHDRPTNLYTLAEARITNVELEERTTEYCTSDEV
jgi:hypothetical protein